MKKLLIYLSVIGISLAVLPMQAEAGNRKHGCWGHHHGYYSRGCYGHYYLGFPYYCGGYWCRYHSYPGSPGVSFSFQFD
jgi:hypothetical protein